MKKAETGMEDDLRPEYDLRALRVRRLGAGRTLYVIDARGRAVTLWSLPDT